MFIIYWNQTVIIVKRTIIINKQLVIKKKTQQHWLKRKEKKDNSNRICDICLKLPIECSFHSGSLQDHSFIIMSDSENMLWYPKVLDFLKFYLISNYEIYWNDLEIAPCSMFKNPLILFIEGFTLYFN